MATATCDQRNPKRGIRPSQSKAARVKRSDRRREFRAPIKIDEPSGHDRRSGAPGGKLMIHGEHPDLKTLAPRRADLFKERAAKIAFVKGEGKVSFAEVARATDWGE